MPLTLRAFRKSFLILLLFSLSGVAAANKGAGQYITDDKYEIHYIALGTTLLTPEIAKQYGVQRSRFNGFVNISILDTSKPGNPAVKATLSGKATNLLGAKKELDFKEIIEGKAIYYIAELAYRNEEQFNIEVSLENGSGLNTKLNFQQKFWVD